MSVRAVDEMGILERERVIGMGEGWWRGGEWVVTLVYF